MNTILTKQIKEKIKDLFRGSRKLDRKTISELTKLGYLVEDSPGAKHYKRIYYKDRFVIAAGTRSDAGRGGISFALDLIHLAEGKPIKGELVGTIERGGRYS